MEDRTGQPDTLPGCPSRDLLEMHAFAAEDLSPLQRKQVVEHLAACPVCAEAYLSLCQLEEQLIADTPSADAGAMPAESATSDGQILEGLWKCMTAEEVVTGFRRTLWLGERRVLVAVAASLLMTLGLAVWWYASLEGQGGDPGAVLAANSGVAGRTDLSREAVWAESSVVLAEPAPFDPDKVDYEKWRDEHREWFATTFPWIFEAQKVLQGMGIPADYPELLMVSGDVWQFRFDATGPVDQPLAVYDMAAVERIAIHYKVPVEAMRRGIASPVHEGRSGDTAGVPVAAPLDRWRVAIASAGHGDGAAQVDLLTSSLRAAIYLRNTRAAACLWVGRNPRSAQGVLASSMVPASPAATFASISVQALSRQCTAAQQMFCAALQLVAAPPSNQCARMDEQWHRMEACLQTLEEEGLWASFR